MILRELFIDQPYGRESCFPAPGFIVTRLAKLERQVFGQSAPREITSIERTESSIKLTNLSSLFQILYKYFTISALLDWIPDVALRLRRNQVNCGSKTGSRRLNADAVRRGGAADMTVWFKPSGVRSLADRCLSDFPGRGPAVAL
jgi:hypothetical protein